ncbi:uncharacterized protein C8R40DRAFT_681641 [Lentinula edodes]|uniref:uncharacterized protein n=1 Tax=Lentinula edodes TaxID=5353 RepID=UPI001E8DC736|nr:uncharacterized protein C8R40DRAFT_681641 [Lentinula edodes]KAH7878859.1 hypothetical protein C8R40DRAFT_681641 [Lentinula edodes]
MIPSTTEEGPDAERGVIVLFEGQPGQAAYSATKGALRSMALPLARDLARHSIRVMAIAPNMFDGLVYPKRFGQPFEFAQTVQWILQCAYVNGETVRLSGASRMPAKM